MLLSVKSNQKTLHRQIVCQFEEKRHIPFTATDHENRHGRQTHWELKAKAAPRSHQGELARQRLDRGADHHDDHAQLQAERQPPSVWPPADCVYITTVGTAPEGLLRLIRQRWSI